MNNIFGNFGCGCNKGCDTCDGGFDSCWLIILLMLCGCCKMDNIDPCTLILFLLFNNCCGNDKHNHCCN